MAIPGLLVEYLLSGALALVWLAPLLKQLNVDLSSPGVTALLAVLLYGVGMAVDCFAYWMVKPVKARLRLLAFRRHGDLRYQFEPSSIRRQVKLSLYAPELAREVAMRSSRDRIARGAVANALIALVIEHALKLYQANLPVWGWLIVIVILAFLWATFEQVSFAYEIRAEYAVDKKEGFKPTSD